MTTTEETKVEEATGPPPIEKVVSALRKVREVGVSVFGMGDDFDVETPVVVQEFRDAFPGASDELLVRFAHHEAILLSNTRGDSLTAAISCTLTGSVGAAIAEAAGLGS